MNREFKYCENPDAEVPRMFIDKEIGGKDADGNPNIDGHLFLKELMYVSDVLGKSKIEVWINSPGGLVTEGQSIYAAILESKATVDTVCYGMAASIAGVIFQAGRKRIMLDYANLMYHPAYNEDRTMDKGLEALNKAICTMIAKRTTKTDDEVWKIMNRGRSDDKGTWIQAEEAKTNGFCDEVRHSDAKNKNAIDQDTFTSIWKSANKVYNRTTEPKPPIKDNNMKKVCNKLGLIEDASEDSIITAIDAKNKSMESLQKKYDDLQEEMKKCKEEMKAMKNAKDAKDAEEETAKAQALKDKETKDAEDAKKNAKNAVTAAVTAGKIKNDATTIKKWEDAYVANETVTKDLIEALPATKVAASFKPKEGEEIKDSPAESAARNMGLKPGTAGWYNAIKSYQIQDVK